jgi:hypothetical protein
LGDHGLGDIPRRCFGGKHRQPGVRQMEHIVSGTREPVCHINLRFAGITPVLGGF